MIALCLNQGSSSLKHALFRGEELIARSETVDLREVAAGLKLAPEIIVHRFVHGGPRHHLPSLATPPLLAELEAAQNLAPLHLPGELRLVREAAALWKKIPQALCFDTDFHWHLPEVARRLPIPQELHDAGVRHYGFHGLSYASVLDALGESGAGKLVIAHLGSGASLAAVRDGRSIDTSMGFSPMGGVPMSSRAGDVDPGLAVYLSRAHGLDGDGLEKLFERESGLLGISGTSGDMKKLLDCKEPRAALAVEIFCYQVRLRVGAYAAALGGLDSLIFTGGIGEHAPAIRARVCAGLGFLGVELDEPRNQAGQGLISSGRCAVRVVAADEEKMMARAAGALWLRARAIG